VAALSSRELQEESEVMCWAMASLYFEVQEPLQTCTPYFHTSRTLFPQQEFCYELSMVSALMACYLLESSECGSSGQFLSGPGREVGEIASDQAD
jgi:hypothetical protein